MPASKSLPFSRMQNISASGIFLKHFVQYGKTEMRPCAHRDDYYIVALLTGGSAAIEVDFERIELHPGQILIISPMQAHRKPPHEQWCADGWMLAFAPEFLSEAEVRALDEYSISPYPLSPGEAVVSDIVALCARNVRVLSYRDCHFRREAYVGNFFAVAGDCNSLFAIAFHKAVVHWLKWDEDIGLCIDESIVVDFFIFLHSESIFVGIEPAVGLKCPRHRRHAFFEFVDAEVIGGAKFNGIALGFVWQVECRGYFDCRSIPKREFPV